MTSSNRAGPSRPSRRKDRKKSTRAASPQASKASDRARALAADARTAATRNDLHRALRLCRQALDADPFNVDALTLAGQIACHQGDAALGVDLLTKVTELIPGEARAYNNLGNAHVAAGDYAAAAGAYEKALGLDPNLHSARLNLGNALWALGDVEDAARQINRVAEEQPDDLEALAALGGISQILLKFDVAEKALSAAVEIRPEDPALWFNLGAACAEQYKFDEAVDAYGRALELAPESAEIRASFADVLDNAGRLEEAETEYRKALEQAGDDVRIMTNLGGLLDKVGKRDEAIALYRQVLVAEPNHALAHVNLGVAQLAGGDAGAALQSFDACLGIDPTSRSALAYKIAALGEAGQTGEVARLLDFDRLIRPMPQEAPEGFTSIKELNSALADHVMGHPTLRPEPNRKTTRKGEQTGTLHPDENPALAAFEAMIRAAVTEYIANAPLGVDHPYLATLPRDADVTWRFNIWGTVLGRQGHQAPHVHPAGWLSGVYYVQVPEAISTGEAGQEKAGWIEFGRPAEGLNCTSDPHVRLYEPREGLLVLFPSFMYHRTIPFESDEKRISIAFDVLTNR